MTELHAPRGATLLLALALACGGAPAWGQAAPGSSQRLYLGSSFLIGSARMVSLGGAYTGIAEGVPGFTANLAAVAHRSPWLERSWDLNVGLTWVDVPLLPTDPRDLDNDGRADQAVSSSQYLFGLMLQYQRYGVGTSLRTSAQRYCFTAGPCAAEDELEVRLSHSALAAGVALGDDDLILGVGFYAANASFTYRGEAWRFSGAGLEVDALYRPHGRSWRIGLSMKPQVTGTFEPAEPSQGRVVSDRPLYAAIVSPGSLAIGASVRLGEGRHRYNRLSPAALRQRTAREGVAPVTSGEAAVGGSSARDEAPPGQWLLTAQLEFTGGVDDAAALGAFTRPAAPEEPVLLAGPLLTPRLGVEHETLPGRLRLRAGSFLEPSPFRDVGTRPHLTGGAEVMVLRYYEDWSITAAFDLARAYRYFSVSIGVWR